MVKPEDNVIKTRKVKTAKKEETKPEPEAKKEAKTCQKKEERFWKEN